MQNKASKGSQSTFSLGLLIFIAVFSITNIPNNFAVLGPQSIFWFTILIFYFIPIALIMAEMASYRSDTNSGISGWVESGTTKKIAFFCGWAYFIENIFYLPMLASRVPVFISWLFADFSDLQTVVEQKGEVPGVITATSSPITFLTLAFAVILIAVVLCFYFEKIFENIGKLVGTISLVVAFGFIIMTICSVVVLGHSPASALNVESIKPTFSPTTITSLVWIIFAIGGVETIGSVVKNVDNPSKQLPKIVIIGSLLVIFAYAVGSLGISFILRPDQLSPEILENAIPVMFAQAGESINLSPIVGISFLKIIMFTQVVITISSLVLWFTTTINVLFVETEESVLPRILTRKSKNGKPLNALVFTTILILIFLIFSSLSITQNVYTLLYNMSTISMVVPFILLLISYINFKRRNLSGNYVFIKNKAVSILTGSILLVITTFAFIFGVVNIDLLSQHKYQEFWSSFIVSFGGLAFFMSVGVFIYFHRTFFKFCKRIFAK